MEHSVYPDFGQNGFVMFNDQELSMEPVNSDDIKPIRAPGDRRYASAAWSCGCDWYFIVTPDGIALLNVHTDEGLYCRKKSARFVEAFVDTLPRHSRRKRTPSRGSAGQTPKK